MVAGIRGNGDWNAPPRGLRNGLHFVILSRKARSTSVESCDEGVDVVLVDEFTYLREVIFCAHTQRRHGPNAGQSTVDHESRQFLQAHFLDEVGSSHLGR